MTRLQELTLKELDQTLSAAEQQELDGLLDQPANQQEYIGLLTLEGELRAQTNAPKLAQAVRARISRTSGDAISGNVMRRIDVEPLPAWRTSPPRRDWRTYFSSRGAVAFAAGLALGLLITLYVVSRPQAPAPVVIGRIDAAMSTNLTRDAQETAAASNSPLNSGDKLAVGASGGAIVEFADNSRVFLEQMSSATLSTRASGAHIDLHSGTLRATVTAQPANTTLTITTPLVTATVLGTRFVLRAVDADTRLDVREGRVHLLRHSDNASVIVQANEFCVVSRNAPLQVQQTPAPTPNPPEMPPASMPRFGVVSFTIVNADTGAPVPGLERIVADTELDLNKLPTNISMYATTVPEEVGSVVFDFGGKQPLRTENTPAYAVSSNWEKDFYLPWKLDAGKLTVTATPYTLNNGRGTAGEALSVTFTVIGNK